jgi:V/A-type H+-transporting ATPase subunit K
MDKKTEVVNMNVNTLKMSLRTLILLAAITMVAQGVAAAETTGASDGDGYSAIGAGIALGLAGLGAGVSQAAIGSAAVGMLAEDGSKFGVALIFTALPESIVILGALPLFL